MKPGSCRLAGLLLALCSVGLCAAALSAARLERATAGQNGDGRPHVWRHFDAAGRVVRVDVDSNFDGRPDIEEYYERGVLVRREFDRDFNGQADLVEEFDAATRGQTRAVVDVDYDGIADVLVLFRDGRAVFSTSTCETCRVAAMRHAAAVGRADGALVPLTDPFASEAALRTHQGAPADPGSVGLSTSGGLPADAGARTSVLAPSTFVAASGADPRPPALLLPRCPRAPPALA